MKLLSMVVLSKSDDETLKFLRSFSSRWCHYSVVNFVL